ncbi:single-stranded DNA-binding protein [Liquorilactobacillus satsumensis]|uniref:single-stranded DNA-binding protein n=2 Tax=Lactobacillaceae TaxID=33958 RepID=UPI0021C32A2E|nr:single-stranded DNA-binding protein [Liquorilactobacillus satsumensis]MCP9313834.1 single-stranded DNA-binding protein [Liquorilactobacillus satsumensis]MCP9360975.1 single-stranded DNA-binding protein [Liquorilactobacillus satsumensis]
MNSVNLVGRLTRDLDLRYTSSGKAVASFTLAVNRPFKNQNGEQEADFIRCQSWGKGAENLANFTHKGSQIGVSGNIRTGSYEKNGQKVYTTDVVVDHFDLLDSRNSNESSNVTQQKQNDPFSNNRQPVDITDELPF